MPSSTTVDRVSESYELIEANPGGGAALITANERNQMARNRTLAAAVIRGG
jgi:hypothetical protein